MDKPPQFQILDELVAFWDEHDFADYMDEMEEVAEEGLPGQKQQMVRQWLEERIAREMV
jgi:hypothetical protein